MNKSILLIAFSFVMLSCGGKETKTVVKQTPVKVTLNQKNTLDTNQGLISASGKIESESSANLSTRMMGYVVKVPVKVGQKVQAGNH